LGFGFKVYDVGFRDKSSGFEVYQRCALDSVADSSPALRNGALSSSLPLESANRSDPKFASPTPPPTPLIGWEVLSWRPSSNETPPSSPSPPLHASLRRYCASVSGYANGSRAPCSSSGSSSASQAAPPPCLRFRI
jgi:hypothetical protein